MSSATIGFADAIGFVDHATSDQVTAIEAAATQRLMSLGSALKIGDAVRIDGLKSTYLNGLLGTVHGFAHTRVVVRVTGDALEGLKRNSVRVDEAAEHYDIRVPRKCATPPQTADERAQELAATVSESPVTAEDVLTYLSNAPGIRVRLIHSACCTRTTALRTTAKRINAATLAEGDNVTIEGMSPKYLNGLSGKLGTITLAKRAYAVVHLDAHSTERLRTNGKKSHWVKPDASIYPLDGIPLTACTPTAG